MALGKSALSDLLDALRAGGDLDVIREGLALVLQALDRGRGHPAHRRRPYERTEHPHHPSQRHPIAAAVDQGR